jgi:hypothetical protein
VPLATALCKTFPLRMLKTVEQAKTQLRVVVPIEGEYSLALYSDMLRHQLKPAVEQNAALCCLLACVCSMTRLTSYRETDPEFKIGDVVPPTIFTRFGTQRFAPLLALRDAVCGRHFR